MEHDVFQNLIRPKTLLVGNIYVSRSLIRVRIDRNMFDEKRSLCFCIDYGYEEWFAMADIFVCKPQFRKFPAQAICLSLFGLEDFADFADANVHLDNVLIGALVGEVLTNQNEYEAQQASDEQTAKVSVCLYDTSSAEDILLNDVIQSRICDSFLPPALQMDSLTNIVISHVDEEGAIFCQPQNSFGSLQYVMKLIHHITNFKFDRDAHRISCVEDVNGSTQKKPVYLVQDSESAKWYRATVLQRNGSVYRMFYVDFGMTRLVCGANIFRLSSLSAALNRFPHQAIKCHLNGIHGLPVASVVANLRGYLNANTPAIVIIFNPSIFVLFVKNYFFSAQSRFQESDSSNCANIHSSS